jgi:hypothetical protein
MTITSTGGRIWLRTDIRGRFRHIDLQVRLASLELPAGPAGWIEIPGGKPILARIDGKPIAAGKDRIAIPARDRVLRLELFREEE